MPILCVIATSAETGRHALLDALDAVSPLVEDAGRDRIYLEMRGIPGLPRHWFAHIRQIVGPFAAVARLGLARNKSIAYLAARLRDGAVIRPQHERTFLRPLPITALELDAATEEYLWALGLRTFGQIADLPPGTLARRLGKTGRRIVQIVCGNEAEPIVPRPRRLQIAGEQRYEGGIFSAEALAFALTALTERIGADLQRAGLQAGALRITLEDDNAVAHEIQVAISRPTAHAVTLLAVLRARLEGLRLNAPVVRLHLQARQLEEGGSPLEFLRGDDADIDALALALARIHAAMGAEVAHYYSAAPAHLAEEQYQIHTLAHTGFKPPRARPVAPLQTGTLIFRQLPPQIIPIQQRHGRPAWFGHERTPILEVAGPWRIHPSWWITPETALEAARDEYDIVLDDGRLLRIARTRLGWELRGCYD